MRERIIGDVRQGKSDHEARVMELFCLVENTEYQLYLELVEYTWIGFIVHIVSRLSARFKFSVGAV